MQPDRMISDFFKKYEELNLAITIERENDDNENSILNYVVTIKLMNEQNSFSWEAKAKTKKEAVSLAIQKAELELPSLI